MKFASFLDVDSYNRNRLDHSLFVFVEENFKCVKFYKIECLIDKRENARKDEYLFRWKEYDLKWDEWRNLLELDEAMNLVREYNETFQETLYLSRRLNRDVLRKTFNENSSINLIILETSNIMSSSQKSFANTLFQSLSKKFAIVVSKSFLSSLSIFKSMRLSTSSSSMTFISCLSNKRFSSSTNDRSNLVVFLESTSRRFSRLAKRIRLSWHWNVETTSFFLLVKDCYDAINIETYSCLTSRRLERYISNETSLLRKSFVERRNF